MRIAPLDVQYQNASILGRLVTNFAGPMNNFILGFVAFLIVIFMQGGAPNSNTNMVTVVDGGALEQAGVVTGDKIVSIEGRGVSSYEEIAKEIATATKDQKEAPTLDVVVEHDGQKKSLSVTTKEEKGAYYLGVSPSLKTGFVDKIVGAFQQTGVTALTIVTALRNLIAQFSLDKLGGPVAIYNISSQAAKNGLTSVLQLLAMLSINLGIFNLIPIPALDGGKILMNIIEAIRRKHLKQETESYITLAGVAIMVVLIIAVTWNDIMRIFF